MQRKPLKAFTLLELTLVLALGAMVTLLGWMGWEVLQQQLTGFKDTREQHLAAFYWHNRLQREIADAQTLQGNGTGWQLIMPTGTTITYALEGDSLAHYQWGQRTVFPYTIDQVELSWKTVPNLSPEDLADQVQWWANYEGTPLHFTFHKHYGADRLMQQALIP